MQNLIFVENYVFGWEWFHSAGVKRVDTRTKEKRAEALASGEVVKPQAWPVTLQLYIRSPDDTLRVLNFQSRKGEEGTIDLFLDILHQLGAFTLGTANSKDYKVFLMEDLQIQEQAKPAKEKQDGQRPNGQSAKGSERGVQGNTGGNLGGDERRGNKSQSSRPQDYHPTGTAGPPEGVSNQ